MFLRRFIFPAILELLIHAIKTTRHLKQRFFELKDLIDVEVATLNTFVYKNNNRFHNDKGFKDVRIVQVNDCFAHKTLMY
jgi:hypothetical protein